MFLPLILVVIAIVSDCLERLSRNPCHALCKTLLT